MRVCTTRRGLAGILKQLYPRFYAPSLVGGNVNTFLLQGCVKSLCAHVRIFFYQEHLVLLMATVMQTFKLLLFVADQNTSWYILVRISLVNTDQGVPVAVLWEKIRTLGKQIPDLVATTYLSRRREERTPNTFVKGQSVSTCVNRATGLQIWREKGRKSSGIRSNVRRDTL